MAQQRSPAAASSCLLEAHDDLVCAHHRPCLRLNAGHHPLQLRVQHIAHLHRLNHRHLHMHGWEGGWGEGARLGHTCRTQAWCNRPLLPGAPRLPG